MHPVARPRGKPRLLTEHLELDGFRVRGEACADAGVDLDSVASGVGQLCVADTELVAGDGDPAQVLGGRVDRPRPSGPNSQRGAAPWGVPSHQHHVGEVDDGEEDVRSGLDQNRVGLELDGDRLLGQTEPHQD